MTSWERCVYKYSWEGPSQNKRPWRLFNDCSKGVKNLPTMIGFVQGRNSILKNALLTCSVNFLSHFIWTLFVLQLSGVVEWSTKNGILKKCPSYLHCKVFVSYHLKRSSFFNYKRYSRVTYRRYTWRLGQCRPISCRNMLLGMLRFRVSWTRQLPFTKAKENIFVEHKKQKYVMKT
jgi:hypothetical protein